MASRQSSSPSTAPRALFHHHQVLRRVVSPRCERRLESISPTSRRSFGGLVLASVIRLAHLSLARPVTCSDRGPESSTIRRARAQRPDTGRIRRRSPRRCTPNRGPPRFRALPRSDWYLQADIYRHRKACAGATPAWSRAGARPGRSARITNSDDLRRTPRRRPLRLTLDVGVRMSLPGSCRPIRQSRTSSPAQLVLRRAFLAARRPLPPPAPARDRSRPAVRDWPAQVAAR